VGLVALGAILVAFKVVSADELLDWLTALAIAAVAAGNILARAFLAPREEEPRGIDPSGPNA